MALEAEASKVELNATLSSLEVNLEKNCDRDHPRNVVYKIHEYLVQQQRSASWSTTMPWKLASNAFIICLAYVLLFLLKTSLRFLKARLALKHIPGPRPSSLVWGEEWLLYHSLPGSAYLSWHKIYGKVVKFTGAFGVSNAYPDIRRYSTFSYYSISFCR